LSTVESKLRVLTLVDGIGHHGGGETLAREITTRLDKSRFEAIFCVTRWQPSPEFSGALAELDGAGVRFVGLERGGRLDLRPWGRVLRMLRGGVDILHSHKFGSNVWAAGLTLLARPPVFVAHEHTWSYSGDRPRILLDRRLIAPRADAFVAVSRDDQRKMVEIERIPPEKTRFIPNGIDLEPPPEDAGKRVRRELGLDPGQPVIGTVATLRAQKALDVLIEAALMLREEFPDLAVLIAGGADPTAAEEAARLKALAERLGAGETVRFLGPRDDIPSLLAALDVAVISSDYEGSPLSVMEYMEAALPVVATRVGGVPDIVVDGETGFLVPPRDPAAITAALTRLLAEPELARRMGEAGRRRRRAEFDLSATVRRVEQLYEELYRANMLDA
jgi:glycosyltransferase involved in cell wall biosynthesis